MFRKDSTDFTLQVDAQTLTGFDFVGKRCERRTLRLEILYIFVMYCKSMCPEAGNQLPIPTAALKLQSWRLR
jgi:hypothetical protein